MSEVDCPYCKHNQEINHDDGYGYDEDNDHEQYCSNCGKYFRYTTHIIFHYDVYCHPAVAEHVLENSERHPNLFCCINCEYSELRK
jgi:hypothetical protein